MNSTAEEHEHAWIDGEADLRWEAVTRVLGFVIANAALLSATGVWLIASGQLVDGLCQTSTANTDKTLLQACQGRLDVDGLQISVLADATVPAAMALAGTASALLVLGAVLMSGVAGPTRGLTTRLETPFIWMARAVTVITSFGVMWLALLSVERLLEIRSLL